MPGTTVRDTLKIPSTLTARVSRQSPSLMLSREPRRAMPALLMRISNGSPSACKALTAARTEAATATSPTALAAARPSARISAAAASAAAPSTSRMAMSHPSRASSRPMARPIPWAPPVTIARFPASPGMAYLCFFSCAAPGWPDRLTDRCAGAAVENVQTIDRYREIDACTGCQREFRVNAGNAQIAVADANSQQLFIAELLAHHQVAAEGNLFAVARAAEPQVLRPHAERD